MKKRIISFFTALSMTFMLFCTSNTLVVWADCPRHIYSYQSNDTQHRRVCGICGYPSNAEWQDHTDGTATCTAASAVKIRQSCGAYIC